MIKAPTPGLASITLIKAEPGSRKRPHENGDVSSLLTSPSPHDDRRHHDEGAHLIIVFFSRVGFSDLVSNNELTDSINSQL